MQVADSRCRYIGTPFQRLVDSSLPPLLSGRGLPVHHPPHHLRLHLPPIAWWDRHVVDGFFNFLAWSAEATSDEIRGLQSGRIQQYTFVFLLGTLALILLLLL